MKETNMEHYRDEIEKNKYSVAMRNGKLTKCKEIDCAECKFNTVNCVREKTKWLMSEYKEEPVLTQREKHFVEFAQTGWLARDIDGVLHWFMRIPDRNEEEDMRCWNGPVHAFAFKKLNEIFPFITWDEEAWNIEELRKLKVSDG